MSNIFLTGKPTLVLKFAFCFSFRLTSHGELPLFNVHNITGVSARALKRLESLQKFLCTMEDHFPPSSFVSRSSCRKICERTCGWARSAQLTRNAGRNEPLGGRAQSACAVFSQISGYVANVKRSTPDDWARQNRVKEKKEKPHNSLWVMCIRPTT